MLLIKTRLGESLALSIFSSVLRETGLLVFRCHSDSRWLSSAFTIHHPDGNS